MTRDAFGVEIRPTRWAARHTANIGADPTAVTSVSNGRMLPGRRSSMKSWAVRVRVRGMHDTTEVAMMSGQHAAVSMGVDTWSCEVRVAHTFNYAQSQRQSPKRAVLKVTWRAQPQQKNLFRELHTPEAHGAHAFTGNLLTTGAYADSGAQPHCGQLRPRGHDHCGHEDAVRSNCGERKRPPAIPHG